MILVHVNTINEVAGSVRWMRGVAGVARGGGAMRGLAVAVACSAVASSISLGLSNKGVGWVF